MMEGEQAPEVGELEEASNTESSEDEQHDIQHSDSDEEAPQLHQALNNLHAALGPQAPSHPPSLLPPPPGHATPSPRALVIPL